jgi:hypothetical protein
MASPSSVKLKSLPPSEVLGKLDLSRETLASVRLALDSGDSETAVERLLEYYRGKHPKKAGHPVEPETLETADKVVEHIFSWAHYEEADYGQQIDWMWDPRNEIEWVARMYRYTWVTPLSAAFRATGDEKYAETFVDLMSDWIDKHPLEKYPWPHPSYVAYGDFPWNAIQAGDRAQVLCREFPSLIHSKAFGPEFLNRFLASIYDHLIRMEAIPYDRDNNFLFIELTGFLTLLDTFPEFEDATRLRNIILQRATAGLFRQTTSEGTQTEWAAGYHVSVAQYARLIGELLEAAGVKVPGSYWDRIHRMYRYAMAISTPNLWLPMFGDCSREEVEGTSRPEQELSGPLLEAGKQFNDPQLSAVVELRKEDLPDPTCFAFKEGGTYVFRNSWDPDQIYFALHCSPPAASHDQPDNGTFELCAYGRWLITDTGYYVYGNDPEQRAWHRQTSVHQTLTLNGENARVDGRHLLWHDDQNISALVCENPSYPGLKHRRTVWFVDRSFFVILDEALGEAQGNLDLHFQLAVGDTTLELNQNRARTTFDDVNVLVWADPEASMTMEAEQGWFAWKYGHRKERKAFRYRHRGDCPAAFLTMIVPFKGQDTPDVRASLSENSKVGGKRVEVDLIFEGKSSRIGRDLERGEAWHV